MLIPCYDVDEKMNFDKKKGDKETMNVKQPLYRLIARAGDAARYCEEHGNTEWKQAWEELLAKFEELLPSGSGFDAGTKIEHAGASKIVLRTSFHHMNENGYYDGWTEHVITVIPDLVNGFDLRISGRNRNGIKEYIADVFFDVLKQEFIWDGHKIKRAEP